MIIIDNEEPTIPVNEEQLHTDAQRILTLLGYGDFDLGILLTNNEAIQQFNRDYRSKDEPTDILSFPFHPDLKAGEKIIATTEDDKNVGDVVISLEYIKPLCEQEHKTINEYLQMLLCHGICHLLGYDHYSPETDKVMKEKEAWLAESLAKNEV